MKIGDGNYVFYFREIWNRMWLSLRSLQYIPPWADIIPVSTTCNLSRQPATVQWTCSFPVMCSTIRTRKCSIRRFIWKMPKGDNITGPKKISSVKSMKNQSTQFKAKLGLIHTCFAWWEVNLWESILPSDAKLSYTYDECAATWDGGCLKKKKKSHIAGSRAHHCSHR